MLQPQALRGTHGIGASPRDSFGCHDGEHIEAWRLIHLTSAQGEQGVAIVECVHGPDSTRQAIVPCSRKTLSLRFREDGVGGDNAYGGIGSGKNGKRRLASQQCVMTVSKAVAVGCASTCQHSTSLGIEHITQRIDRDQCAHGDPIHGHGRTTDAAFHGELHAEQFSNTCTRTRTHVALCGDSHAGRLAGRVAAGSVWPDTGIADVQIEKHRGRNNRHTRRPHVQTNALLVKPTHDTTGRIKPECAATGEHDRMDSIHQIGGVQQVSLARSRSRSAHIHAANSPRTSEHHAATSWTTGVGEMPDLHTANIGD